MLAVASIVVAVALSWSQALAFATVLLTIAIIIGTSCLQGARLGQVVFPVHAPASPSSIVAVREGERQCSFLASFSRLFFLLLSLFLSSPPHTNLSYASSCCFFFPGPGPSSESPTSVREDSTLQFSSGCDLSADGEVVLAPKRRRAFFEKEAQRVASNKLDSMGATTTHGGSCLDDCNIFHTRAQSPNHADLTWRLGRLEAEATKERRERKAELAQERREREAQQAKERREREKLSQRVDRLAKRAIFHKLRVRLLGRSGGVLLAGDGGVKGNWNKLVADMEAKPSELSVLGLRVGDLQITQYGPSTEQDFCNIAAHNFTEGDLDDMVAAQPPVDCELFGRLLAAAR